MNLEQARDLLHTQASTGGHIKTPDEYFAHCEAVAAYAFEVAQRMRALDVPAETIQVAGLVHDIGKCLTPDLHNETWVGADYLRAHGQRELGRIIETHLTQAELLELQQERGEAADAVKHRNPIDFIPKSVAQVVVAYADLHYAGGHKMQPQDRIEDLLERYAGDVLFVDSIFKARDRLIHMCRLCKHLAGGYE